ncbi:MAG: DUF1850 domain-containing protein [Rubrimonas sp.]
MIGSGRSALFWPAVLSALIGGAPVAACPLGLAVVRVADGVELARVDAASFTLEWRHSVTLTMVRDVYVLSPEGRIRQVEERFAAHGPGMAHDGAGWRREDGEFVLPLDRPLDRLILRAAPEHRNRLRAGGADIDLTLWSGQPLELKPVPCPLQEPAP